MSEYLHFAVDWATDNEEGQHFSMKDRFSSDDIYHEFVNNGFHEHLEQKYQTIDIGGDDQYFELGLPDADLHNDPEQLSKDILNDVLSHMKEKYLTY